MAQDKTAAEVIAGFICFIIIVRVLRVIIRPVLYFLSIQLTSNPTFMGSRLVPVLTIN